MCSATLLSPTDDGTLLRRDPATAGVLLRLSAVGTGVSALSRSRVPAEKTSALRLTVSIDKRHDLGVVGIVRQHPAGAAEQGRNEFELICKQAKFVSQALGHADILAHQSQRKAGIERFRNEVALGFILGRIVSAS